MCSLEGSLEAALVVIAHGSGTSGDENVLCWTILQVSPRCNRDREPVVFLYSVLTLLQVIEHGLCPMEGPKPRTVSLLFY